MAETPTIVDFESALGELEKIIERLESGQQTLEEALLAFQRGIELTRVCQRGLQEAEQKVEQLLQERDGTVRVAPFSPPDDVR